MYQEKHFLVALSQVSGIGCVLAKQLIAYFGSAEAVFAAPKGKLQKVAGIGEVLSNEIIKKNTFEKAQKVLADCEKKNTRLIFYHEAEYPALLKEIPDAPIYLYWQGEQKAPFHRAIAIVGTRQCTEYGKKATEQLVEELRPYQPVIVSGFAYGIDIVAHKAAIKQGLPTLAVLGGGLDTIYPASHKRYVEEVKANGAMISEYHFDVTPEAMHFPARNRIVAGMCEAVVVVEAAESGGALITAELANDYNREVFAVPGNLGNKFSEGCNKLIAQNKAAIFYGVDDLVQRLGWDSATASKKKLPKELPTDLTESEQKICHLLKDSNAMHIDPLAWKSQLHVNELASVLLSLEIKGLVSALPGKKYKLS
jgi:DNA processing protein